MVIAMEISSERTARPRERDELAVRKRRRSGAASSRLDLVVTPLPVIPITARIVMNRLLVSEAKTSVRTSSWLGP